MTDEKNTDEQQAEEPKLNTDYYDEPEEGAHERSHENSSIADPATRDLWQSTNVSTDGSGPLIHEVAPVFAQARADALAHPVTADDDDDRVQNEQADAAAAAQEEADRIRNSGGFAAKTGADAGQFDDSSVEGSVPSENFSPEPNDDENSSDDKSGDEAKAEDARAASEDQQNPSADSQDQGGARAGDAGGAKKK